MHVAHGQVGTVSAGCDLGTALDQVQLVELEGLGHAVGEDHMVTMGAALFAKNPHFYPILVNSQVCLLLQLCFLIFWCLFLYSIIEKLTFGLISRIYGIG